jgi:hypothetical protein
MGDLVSLVKARLEAEELLDDMKPRQATAHDNGVVIMDSGKKSEDL